MVNTRMYVNNFGNENRSEFGRGARRNRGSSSARSARRAILDAPARRGRRPELRRPSRLGDGAENADAGESRSHSRRFRTPSRAASHPYCGVTTIGRAAVLIRRMAKVPGYSSRAPRRLMLQLACIGDVGQSSNQPFGLCVRSNALMKRYPHF